MFRHLLGLEFVQDSILFVWIWSDVIWTSWLFLLARFGKRLLEVLFVHLTLGWRFEHFASWSWVCWPCCSLIWVHWCIWLWLNYLSSQTKLPCWRWWSCCSLIIHLKMKDLNIRLSTSRILICLSYGSIFAKLENYGDGSNLDQGHFGLKVDTHCC